jgi:beta-galactosidase/beta-glucuronidase
MTNLQNEIKLTSIMIKKFLILALALLFSTDIYAQWKPAGNKIKTVWADSVTPKNVWQEYPRPNLQRSAWMNLNGLWSYAIQAKGLNEPTKFDGSILVPFPVESSLSGVQRQLDGNSELWYQRTFTIPKAWSNSNVILHFEAVDWDAKVFINDKEVGEHKGGYDAFAFNVTSFLKKGKNKLSIRVYDPSNSGHQASGKQALGMFSDPQGAFYTTYSGIWQTVWMEPVAATHIEDVKIVPDIDSSTFHINVATTGNAGNAVEITVKDNGNTVATQRATAGNDVAVTIANAKLWDTTNPFLYDIEVKLLDNNSIIDEVKSYAGMRLISIEKFNDVPRICLNHQPIYEHGSLDQGYWPDGISTMPSDNALQWEIKSIKDFGFNMIRKHMKIEPKRWYYWCDKVGLLVWQDMPCPAIGAVKLSEENDKRQFESEIAQMVNQHYNEPCIVVWTIFNEHWGAYDVERLVNNVKELDPHRLVMGNSGIDARNPTMDYECGNIKDNHSYLPPNLPLISDRRATVDGEYGALGYTIPGHIWSTNGKYFHNYYQDKADKKEAATQQYLEFIKSVYDYAKRGLSATVYTQWTDVENEVNGIYTYDRKVIKLDKARITEANKKCYEIPLK